MENVRGRAQSAIDQANQLFQGRRSEYASHVDTLVHLMQSRFLALQVLAIICMGPWAAWHAFSEGCAGNAGEGKSDIA